MKSSILILFILLTQSILAQSLSDEVLKQVEEIATAYIQEDAPGSAVGIISQGEVVYENYKGFADLDSMRSIDGLTQFNIASLAKQFTALCLLKLAHEEQLSLDDDIRKYLPNLLPNIDTAITITQLINHTSGIRGINNLQSLQGVTWWKAEQDNDDALALLEQQTALNFPPGSRRMYTNSNYILLTHIVARVTGKSFKDYSRTVFDELGMKNTFFHTNFREPVERLARPYFNFDTWFTYELRSDQHGDGSLYTTLPDQLRWETLLQDVAKKESNLPKAWQEILAASQQPLAGDGSYGFGLEFDDYRSIPCRYHDGSTGAWKASTIRFPAYDLTIFAATNSGALWPPGTVRELADVLLPAEKLTDNTIPLVPETIAPAQPLEAILGTYRTEGDYFCRIKTEEGKIYLERLGRDDIEIQQESGGLYNETTDTPFKQHFVVNEAEEMTVTFYYTNTAPFTFTKVNAQQKWPEATSLEGSYRNAETNASFSVKHKGEDRYIITSFGEENDACLFTPTKLIMSGLQLVISKKAEGQVTEWLLNDNRLRRVSFVRVED